MSNQFVNISATKKPITRKKIFKRNIEGFVKGIANRWMNGMRGIEDDFFEGIMERCAALTGLRFSSLLTRAFSPGFKIAGFQPSELVR